MIGIDDIKAAYLLQDSYVIQISIGAECTFHVQLALSEIHDQWTAPPSDEMYCYRSGDLRFRNIRSIKGDIRINSIFSEDGEDSDIGNIDTLEQVDSGEYVITGDWGDLRILAGNVEMLLK